MEIEWLNGLWFSLQWSETATTRHVSHALINLLDSKSGRRAPAAESKTGTLKPRQVRANRLCLSPGGEHTVLAGRASLEEIYSPILHNSIVQSGGFDHPEF